jgi:hypothetical protein
MQAEESFPGLRGFPVRSLLHLGGGHVRHLVFLRSFNAEVLFRVDPDHDHQLP